jgi:hypothetical protein
MVANLKSLYIPLDPLPKVDTSWLGGFQNALGSAIDTAAQNKSFEKNVIPAITGQAAPVQQPNFLQRLFGQQSAPNTIPAPAAKQQMAASNPAPQQGTSVGTPNQIQSDFIGTVRNGGLTNPYGLAAVAATGRAESSWDPSKVNAAWPDPSQSGQAGTAGGILSWRNERLANLRNFAQAQGEDPSNISPTTQAQFFLQEDPTLITRLNQARSPQEAAGIMANAWKFAGYDQAGGEAARRAALTQNYYAQQFGKQPTQVADATSQIGDYTPFAPKTETQRAQAQAAMQPTLAKTGDFPTQVQSPAAFDSSRFSSEKEVNGPYELIAALSAPPDDSQLVSTGQQPVAQGDVTASPYTDPQVTTAYQGQPAASQQPKAAPQQVAAKQPTTLAGPSVIAAAQPASRQNVTNDQIAAMVRDPNTRQVGLQLWQQVLTGKTAQPWSFVKLDDGTLARANQSTGEVQSLGQFESAKKNILSNGKGGFYNADTSEWIEPPPGAAGDNKEFFGTTVPYYDGQGNLHQRQLSKDGNGRDLDFGPGGSAAPNTRTVDTGTELVTFGPGGQEISRIPKQNQQEARDKAVGGTEGKNTAEATSALPQVEGAGNQMLATIDSLAKDPYLPNMLGPVNSRKWNLSADSERVKSKMDQINGQAFLQAYNTLRGSGQITEVEGAKATAAMSRLNTAQSVQDYQEALQELRDIVAQGINRARQKAGQQPIEQPSAPSGSTTSSGVQWSIEK